MFFVVVVIIFVALFILKRVIEKNLLSEQERKGTVRKVMPVEKQDPDRSLSSRKIPKVSFAWTWMQCAGKFGFSYLRQGNEQLYPAIEGNEGSCRIRIDAVQGISGEKFDTLMSVEFPVSANLGLRLVKGVDLAEEENMPSPPKNAGDFFESQAMRSLFLLVDDEERFRKDYAVVCEKFLLKNWDFYEDLTLTDDALFLLFKGTHQSMQRFEEMIESLIDAGQCFSALSEHAARSIPAEKGSPAPPAELLQIPTSATEEAAQTAPLPAAVQDEIPGEIVPEESEKEPVPPAAETTLPPQEEVTTGSAEIGQQQETDKESLISALWSSSFPGNAEKTLFETQYKGKTVCWEGVLGSSFPYTFDFIFGQKAGVKSSIELLEITQGTSSFKVKIKAIVSFPEEEASRLRSANGKAVVFQGTLLKYEPLSRELYLTDGRVLSVQER